MCVYPHMPITVTGQFVTLVLQKLCTFWPWKATTEFTKTEDVLPPTQVYHPAKIHRPASTHAGDICHKLLRRNTQTETVNNISQHAYRYVGTKTKLNEYYEQPMIV